MKRMLFPTLGLLLAACAAQTPPADIPADTAENPTILDGRWHIRNIGGSTVSGELNFNGADHSYAGNIGCNTLFGNYHLADATLTFTPPAANLQYCGDAINRQEAAFEQALRNAQQYDIRANRLEIRDSQGQNLITAER